MRKERYLTSDISTYNNYVDEDWSVITDPASATTNTDVEQEPVRVTLLDRLVKPRRLQEPLETDTSFLQKIFQL